MSIVDYRKQLRDLETGLRIDEHNLETHWVEQPDLFYRVSKNLALVISLRDQAKQDLSETEARVDIKVRRDAEVADEKITEKGIESQRKLHPDVRAATTRHSEYSLLTGEYMALKDAYLQRSYALKELVQLYVANYYGASDKPVRDVRDENASRARVQLSRQRRER